MFNEVQYLNTHFTDFCILKTVTLTIKSIERKVMPTNIDENSVNKKSVGKASSLLVMRLDHESCTICVRVIHT